MIVILLVLLMAGAAEGQTTSFILKWTINSNNEEGFNVYRDGAKVGAVAAKIATYTDNNVATQPNQKLCWDVKAYNYSLGNGKGTLQESAPTSACYTVPAPVPTPNAPSGLTAERISSTSNQTSWSLNNPVGTVSILLTRDQIKPAKTTTFNLDVDVDSWVDANLVRSKTYCYRVQAVNAAGTSPYSNQSCATTR